MDQFPDALGVAGIVPYPRPDRCLCYHARASAAKPAACAPRRPSLGPTRLALGRLGGGRGGGGLGGGLGDVRLGGRLGSSSILAGLGGLGRMGFDLAGTAGGADLAEIASRAVGDPLDTRVVGE